MEFVIKAREVSCRSETCVILDLDGELDTYSSPALRESVIQLVNDGKRFILANMSNVSFIDSHGLGTLVGCLKRAAEHDGAFKIVNVNEQIDKVLNVTGLVRVFEKFDSEEEALRSFEK